MFYDTSYMQESIKIVKCDQASGVVFYIHRLKKNAYFIWKNTPTITLSLIEKDTLPIMRKV